MAFVLGNLHLLLMCEVDIVTELDLTPRNKDRLRNISFPALILPPLHLLILCYRNTIGFLLSFLLSSLLLPFPPPAHLPTLSFLSFLPSFLPSLIPFFPYYIPPFLFLSLSPIPPPLFFQTVFQKANVPRITEPANETTAMIRGGMKPANVLRRECQPPPLSLVNFLLR